MIPATLSDSERQALARLAADQRVNPGGWTRVHGPYLVYDRLRRREFIRLLGVAADGARISWKRHFARITEAGLAALRETEDHS